MKRISKSIIGICLTGIATAGCVAVPVGSPNGDVSWQAVPLPLAPAAAANNPYPLNLPARLYPTNDLARQAGMLNGAVTNMRNGKGRFQLSYRGEVLVGEATRNSTGDAHGGVANAWSPQGVYMSCEYRMNNPHQGSGTCNFSDGAHYEVHLGG